MNYTHEARLLKALAVVVLGLYLVAQALIMIKGV